jgi:hypothetical protein
MDRAIVFYTLLLIGLTWLLYKLTVSLEPRNEKPASGSQHADASAEAPTPGNGTSSQKLIHQRLRK